jgi:methylthioribose-1-phosphate isomerase
VTHISGLAESGEIVTVQVTAPRSQAANPAFDVTPVRLITGLMTERGIASGLAQLYSEKAQDAAAA